MQGVRTERQLNLNSIDIVTLELLEISFAGYD